MDIAPPPSPPPAPPPPFPVLGVAAPLVVSVAVWAITRSPYALLFAALGPVVAAAGVVDQRISGRREARRAVRERREALARLLAEVRARIVAGRAALRSRAPAARDILDGRVNPALLWRAEPGRDRATPVLALGTGTVRSGLVWRGEADALVPDPGGGSPSRAGRRLSLLQRALPGAAHSPTSLLSWSELVEWIPDTPVLISSAGGVGLRGSAALVAPVMRGIVVQLVHALPPDDLRILTRPPGTEWDWLARLPHAVAGLAATSDAPLDADSAEIRLLLGEREVLLAMSPRVETLPAACRTVLEVCTPVMARILAIEPAAGSGAGVSDAVSAAGALEARGDSGEPDAGGRGEDRRARVVSSTRDGLVRPELVSRGEVERLADDLAALARRRGLAAARAPLPTRVPFEDLAALVSDAASAVPSRSARSTRSLAAPVGVGHGGPVVVDLVTDGPHAVVAGTTGSGKSELLVTWMAALAAAHPPEEVTFLLVDFKGGAAFDPLLVLPHAVGLVTDLDGEGTRRALESLRAEIHYRERALRATGARNIDDPATAGALPRLVIVVDELAALLADQDGLHDVIADIAARGRSLGMHLVLCTQRPSGVVRDAVLANCDLRLSLRVNNEADSRALLGTPEAAHLPASPVGRCLLGSHGAPARPFQVAVTTTHDLARIASERTPRARVRRPWLDPLPAVVPLTALAASPVRTHTASTAGTQAVPFALADLPAEQRRETTAWSPATDGHLVIVGGPGSGRTTCLETVEASAVAVGRGVLRVPSDIEGCWDALAGVVRSIRDPGSDEHARLHPPLVVLIDDLDIAVSRLDADHQAALLDLLAVVAREGPPAGVALAVAARRAGGSLQAVSAVSGAPVLLGLPSRQEHVLAGGEARLFDARTRPGAGEWRGVRIQVAVAADHDEGSPEVPPAAPDTAPPWELDPGVAHVLITPAPTEAVARLERLGIDVREVIDLPSGTRPEHAGDRSRPTFVVADPDTWLVRGPLLAQLRREGSVILEGCTPRDIRTLLRVRAVPPPLAPIPGRVWLVTPAGSVHRRSWPGHSIEAASPVRPR